MAVDLSKSGREVRTATVSVIFIILCLATFLGIFTYFLANVATQTKRQLEEVTISTAQLVANNGGWLNQMAVQTLRRVDTLVGDDVNSVNSEAFSKQALDRPPGSIVSLIGRNGLVVFSTSREDVVGSLEGLTVFTAVRDGTPFYTSAKVASPTTGKGGFVYSKRITRNDQFVGVVSVAYPNGVLDALARDINLGEGASISLVRRDGRVMARYPSSDVPDLTGDPLFSHHLPLREIGAFFSERSHADGLSKVVAYRAIPGTAIIALAALPTAGAWKSFFDEAVALVVIVSPVCVALLIVWIWMARLLKRDAVHAGELELANETNTMLFRESHHRVKNNLQSVQSLIRLQNIPEDAKRDLQSRLGAMAAMHEHIYRRDEYEDIDAHDIVPVVVQEVIRAYGTPMEITYDVDHCYVDRDHITPLSLLLSELVTNAIKYAFNGVADPKIRIILQDTKNGRCLLTVVDNGIGMPREGVPSTSMGMKLIRGVVAQMAGTYDFAPGSGTRFEANIALSAIGQHIADY